MSKKSLRLSGNVMLSEICTIDDAPVRALYVRKAKPTLEDLRVELANQTPTRLRTLAAPVTIDVSSMYTIAKGLHRDLVDADWAECAEDADGGLDGLLYSAKARGVFLWLAYKLLLEPVHNTTVKLSDETEGAGLALGDVPAGSEGTWLWDLDSNMAGLRWYRHRIAGPLTVYHRRENLAQDAVSSLNHVMANSPLSTGEIYEQVVSRPDIVLTGALLEVNRRIDLPAADPNRIDASGGKTSSRAAGAQILQAALTHDLSTGANPKTLFL